MISKVEKLALVGDGLRELREAAENLANRARLFEAVEAQQTTEAAKRRWRMMRRDADYLSQKLLFFVDTVLIMRDLTVKEAMHREEINQPAGN